MLCGLLGNPAGQVTYFPPCPSPDCSGHGVCQLGTCQCEPLYVGPACATRVHPPVIGAVGGVSPNGTIEVWEGQPFSAMPQLLDGDQPVSGAVADVVPGGAPRPGPLSLRLIQSLLDVPCAAAASVPVSLESSDVRPQL